MQVLLRQKHQCYLYTLFRFGSYFADVSSLIAVEQRPFEMKREKGGKQCLFVSKLLSHTVIKVNIALFKKKISLPF